LSIGFRKIFNKYIAYEEHIKITNSMLYAKLGPWRQLAARPKKTVDFGKRA